MTDTLTTPTLRTRIQKDIRGNWSGKTYAEFELHGRKAQISFDTSKNYRSELATAISVGWISADGFGVLHRFNLGGNGDFYKTVFAEKCRVTQKALSAQHEKAVADFEKYFAEACAHYPTPESLPQ